MYIKTLEDKVVNVDQYKLLKIVTDSGAHGTNYALMITDYENEECLGCWDTEMDAQTALSVLTPALLSPMSQGYVDLNDRVPSTQPAPEPVKKK